MEELKPCPFCGATLVQATWSKGVFNHPTNGCILSHGFNDGFCERGPLEVSGKVYFDLWNRRVKT